MSSVLDTLRGNGVDDLLPGDLADRLDDLGIQDTTVTNPSPGVTVVRGTVLPLTDRGLPQLGGLPLQAPGLTSGLRVQIAIREDGGGSVTDWAVDLDLDRVTLLVPGLRPAREVREPARATRLADEPARSDVRVVGRGVLRIAASGGGTPEVSLIDRLDDQNPFGPHGPVVSLGFDPPSFFLGGSSFGFTVEEMTYDQSTSTSPAPKPAAWRGIALRRATFYLPPGAPLLGDISLGVENVFLGDPVGVEGTATLEFGGAADTPLALVVEQDVGGTWQTLAVSTLTEAGTRNDRVSAALRGSQPPAARVRASLTSTPPGTISWRLPRGQSDPAGFDVLPGDMLEVRRNDEPPTTCAFTGSWTAPPTVDLTVGAASWANVVSVSGTAADLAAVGFSHATATGGPYTWRWDGDPATDSAAAPTGPPAATQARTHVLTLRQGGKDVRRVVVEVRARGPLLVGCRAGVFTLVGGASTPVPVLDVAGTYRLTEWHADALLARALPPATVTGGSVTVGQGQLAEVVTEAVAAGPTPPGPTTGAVATRAHFRFVFDSRELRPADTYWRGEQPENLDRLRAWVDSLGGAARFAVVGRCDDLSAGIPLTATSDTYNRDLAVRRAERTRDLLVAAGVDPARIAARGEQSTWFTAPPASTASLPTEATTVAWVARSTPDYQSWSRSYPGNDAERSPLRRGDVYAYDVTPTSDAVPPAQDGVTLNPARLRTMVPGADPTVVSGAVVPPVPHGRPQYRVRVEVEWNDPAAHSMGESWPVRAEAIVQWPGNTVRLPAPHPNAALARPGDTTTVTPVWTLRGRWAHDRTAGTDDFLLSLDVAGNPDGIAALTSRPLAAAMGLAPAVVGAASSGGGTVTGEDAALVGALIAVIGGAAGSLLRDGSRTVVTGVTIEHLHRGESGPGSRTRLTVDYVVELSVDVAGSGLPLQVRTRPDKPMRLRYRNVGVEIDTGVADWWDGVGLHARDATPEVVDPGSWQLGPPLDDLLRVTGVRSGAQSSWLELDLALSLDLGVVKLSNATVRVVFASTGITGVELRGLKAAVDIPATLRGEGHVDVSGGSIHAGLQLEVVPLKVGAVADLQLGANGFVALMVGVRFPAPIPFANSGLGLFGVVGRFVSNGTRQIDPAADPVSRELAWLERSDKYRSQPGQWALGLGAVVGTVPDLGFTFHALGMVTVEFPKPTVIFAVISKILSDTAPVPSDQATRPAHGLSIIGLVVIDDTAVTIALRGHYAVPGILELDIPVGAYFPYANPTSSWVHVGTDGQPGREGSPVTLTLLPDVLDVRVRAFVLVHGNGLSPGLDGNTDFVFTGFAIGFGAGWEIDWSAGPIRLFASAKVLAGFGTNPRFLAAGIWVRGELDLVVVSVSARGEITLKTDGTRTDLHGEFCGEVDCFFFSIEGCVSIDVSATLGGVPDPPSPVTGVDLVARLGHATAAAAPGTAGGPTVWPDTIPVVHFAHTVENGLTGGDFAVGTPMPGPVWSGSRDVKHAFRITGVRLEPTSGPPLTPASGQLPTAWWWPGVRSSTRPPWLSAADSEPRDLALLSWEPWTGLLPLTQPHGSPGDPGQLVGEVCEPVSRPDPVCLVGELGRPAGAGKTLLPEDPAEADQVLPPARLTLEQPGDRPWSTLVAVATSAGVAVRPGTLAALDHSWDLASGPTRYAGWRLASLVRGGQDLGALGAVGRFDPELEQPTLVLEVCPVPVVRKEPGPVPPRLGCVSFADVDEEQLARRSEKDGTVLRHEGVVVTDLAGRALQAVDFDGDGQWALLLTSGGLRVDLAGPVAEVTVRAVVDQEWEVAAYDGNGNTVDKARAASGATLTLRGDDLVAVEVHAQGEGGLAEVCVPGADPAGESGDLLQWQPGRDRRLQPPEVAGLLPDGREEPWEPEVKGGRRCLTAVYRAPHDGPWAGFRVAAAPGRRVTVVGACGLRWYEALERRQAEEHRLDVVTAMTQFATGAAGTVRATASAPSGVTGEVALPVTYVASPPPRPLLAAGTTYRLTVDWQWQRWERSGASASPGTPDPSRWQNGTSSTFTFRSASLAALPTPSPPVDLIGETSFDPRGLARYVTGAAPSGTLPHLLDDPIRVTFSVDYLAALLDRYGFDTRVEVRPTDVDTGTVPEGSHPGDLVSLVSVVAWVLDDVLLPVEAAVVEASTAAPCVPPTSLGGTAAEVVADLDPERAYDLLLVADPRGSGADVVIRRWHFRTSRYHDVAEILDALGLPAGAPTAVTPDDVLLDRQWPALPAAAGDDAALDAALTALGLDPWPLSPAPRTTTLWVPPDPASGRTSWALGGVLLEAPEPIARPGRVTVGGTVGATSLAVVRSTGNGTRVLLAPTAPVVPASADALTVRLVDSLRGITATGGAQLLGGPRTVRRELP